ncbi:hypothetical protein D5R81_13320 [Parashewanella spongiae]|uniref:Uncharacterized protein n=1 Tax=Parashewanella spongiae TaxID=342950 RepID=A0A3A6U1Z5_9GAMM|nr:hypothetical protein [Parashewanella spongiae]MCL1079471.1 hypothetical protein [Parashewanella spongiae]RJY11341.1 hypothetical protein D5R81_13320 [Parashewanella spongiae]
MATASPTALLTAPLTYDTKTRTLTSFEQSHFDTLTATTQSANKQTSISVKSTKGKISLGTYSYLYKVSFTPTRKKQTDGRIKLRLLTDHSVVGFINKSDLTKQTAAIENAYTKFKTPPLQVQPVLTEKVAYDKSDIAHPQRMSCFMEMSPEDLKKLEQADPLLYGEMQKHKEQGTVQPKLTQQSFIKNDSTDSPQNTSNADEGDPQAGGENRSEGGSQNGGETRFEGSPQNG